MSFIPFIVLWALLALTVLALFVWRKTVASKEDDSLHVLDGAAVEKSVEQIAVAQKLDVIDKWGKIAHHRSGGLRRDFSALYVYQSWVQTPQ